MLAPSTSGDGSVSEELHTVVGIPVRTINRTMGRSGRLGAEEADCQRRLDGRQVDHLEMKTRSLLLQ
jgi:hypothetical protein